MPDRVIVVGVGPEGPARPDLVAAATVLAGGRTTLDEWGGLAVGAHQIAIGGVLAELFDLVDRTPGDVVVLASGDPGFVGIVRALGERYGRRALEVHPAPSSISLAFARVGLSWDDAVVLSAHGRSLDVAALRRARKAAVLTGPDCPPEAVGAALGGL